MVSDIIMHTVCSILLIEFYYTESITRDQNHDTVSFATHTFNVVIPTKQTSAEDVSVYYESVGQGTISIQEIEVCMLLRLVQILDGDQILESTVYADSEYKTSDNQTCSEHEDLFDYVGAHIPTVVSLNKHTCTLL